MDNIKRIALIAHDNRKKDLIEWVDFNVVSLKKHRIICTGTTGRMVEEAINSGERKDTIDYFRVHSLKSGPLGGDQQLGAMIAEGKIDIVIFFWDPMQPVPHDVDVKALLRITVLYNIPTACNRASADFLISSHLFAEEYIPRQEDYGFYINREVK